MKYIDRAVIGLFLLVAVIGIIQAVNAWVFANGWKPLNTSDWASWVQAFGSILAIIYAVRVSNRDRETRDNERVVAAILQGQLLRHELGQFVSMLRYHCEYLHNEDIVRGDRRVEAMLAWFAVQPMWTVEQIALIAGLQNGYAVEFAKGQAAAKEAFVELSYAIDPQAPRGDAETIDYAQSRRARRGLTLCHEALLRLQKVYANIPDELPFLHKSRFL